MEKHPRINTLNARLTTSKIILGSFPTWSLTSPDPDKNESFEQKEKERKKNSDLNFFYGSSINRFWDWYSRFIDNTTKKEDIKSIEHSLKQKGIGITDMILSCERANKSSLDKHLTKRTYNTSFFKYPDSDERIKILCTSKGVMNEMLLNESFFKIHNKLKINEKSSNRFQGDFINHIQGDITKVRKPFYRAIEFESGGVMECISLPSPGSPYRRLIDFGLKNSSADEYLDAYLSEAFEWFKS